MLNRPLPLPLLAIPIFYLFIAYAASHLIKNIFELGDGTTASAVVRAALVLGCLLLSHKEERWVKQARAAQRS